MPNQAHSGIHGVPWHRCERGGEDRRVSELLVEQGIYGPILVCMIHADKPAFDRQTIINAKLSSDMAEAGPAEILLMRETLAEGYDTTKPSVPSPKSVYYPNAPSGMNWKVSSPVVPPGAPPNPDQNPPVGAPPPANPSNAGFGEGGFGTGGFGGDEPGGFGSSGFGADPFGGKGFGT